MPGGFVEPPQEALEQIARDSAELAAAYARDLARGKWSGAFVLPVDGQADEQFRHAQLLQRPAALPHAGVDFVGAPGTPIRAANHGDVVVAAPMYFTGNTIVVDYGDRLILGLRALVRAACEGRRRG